ncbi:dolichyl-phosphate-mannose protein mannosyltransferase, putative, partial [Plasmodium gallinaceum]
HNCLYVTDGSSIILENIGTKYKLFSTDMKWGTGSGNQLVTAVTTNNNEDDLLWTVSVYEEGKSFTGNKINCDEIVTLKHVKSNGYLISSKHESILSNNYELSVHKNNESGKFQVVCENKKHSSYWEVGKNVFLKSVNHNGYLSTSKSYEFNQYNCHNCPILHHLEACIMKYNYQKDEQKWRAKSGVIITQFNEDTNENYGSDEL